MAARSKRWLDPGYRRVYRNIFSGDWDRHDPFDGEFRVEAREFRAPNTEHLLPLLSGVGWR